MQPENHVVTHGGTIDPKTGAFVPKQLTYAVSKFHTDVAILRMNKAGTMDALVAIKDKAKALGLIKSHEKQLREAFAECYRKLKQLTNQPKGNENEE